MKSEKSEKMQKFYKMSDSEMEIMRAVWAMQEEAAPVPASVTVAQLLDVFESRNWKAQTMATFLTRLCEKGLLVATKKGKTNLYVPVVTEREYHQLEAQNLLSSMYEGSLQNFLSALYGGGINANEAGELKEWFERMEKDGER